MAEWSAVADVCTYGDAAVILISTTTLVMADIYARREHLVGPYFGVITEEHTEYMDFAAQLLFLMSEKDVALNVLTFIITIPNSPCAEIVTPTVVSLGRRIEELDGGEFRASYMEKYAAMFPQASNSTLENKRHL